MSDLLHSLAVRLVEGGIVSFEGHSIRAKVVESGEDSCFLCEMDSICNSEMVDLCARCDAYERKPHILVLT